MSNEERSNIDFLLDSMRRGVDLDYQSHAAL